ncbi:MAG TPA: A/G-specific adenine glycosylase [Lachnospiraceae bacterium]|jgi:A/G-specific adenine glycosylase|nr:A/G-specific adenine glycosylase [Lachnospiraceae bacterium]
MNDVATIVRPLLEWYDTNKRNLAWRENPTPYHVWISEIMLQQTRVEAVKGYYERFLAQLPDIEHLAYVEEERLLKLWEGLGYYNRARNLKKAAILIVKEYKGNMPASYEQLIKLPGIGTYTAGAIASIAFGISVPAVDGNVLRVITRVTANEADITLEQTKRNMTAELTKIMPKTRAGAFNQALMDLGAMVCIPNGEPKCTICPLASQCKAYLENKTDKIPYKTPKKARTIEEKTLIVINREGRVLLHKRPEKGLLAGMYEIPSILGFQTKENVLSYVKELGLKPIFIEALPDSKHIFTHKEWRMKAYFVKADDLATNTNITDTKMQYVFVTPEMTEDAYPIPSAFSAYEQFLKLPVNEFSKNQSL